MGAEFLNIELEVRAPFDLLPLLTSMGDAFSPNYCAAVKGGIFMLSGALSDYRVKTVEAKAAGLCSLIEGLPPRARKLWEQARDRVFDIGVDATTDPQVVLELLTPRTMSRIAKVNARLAVSVYTAKLQEHLTKQPLFRAEAEISSRSRRKKPRTQEKGSEKPTGKKRSGKQTGKGKKVSSKPKGNKP